MESLKGIGELGSVGLFVVVGLTTLRVFLFASKLARRVLRAKGMVLELLLNSGSGFLVVVEVVVGEIGLLRVGLFPLLFPNDISAEVKEDKSAREAGRNVRFGISSSSSSSYSRGVSEVGLLLDGGVNLEFPLAPKFDPLEGS